MFGCGKSLISLAVSRFSIPSGHGFGHLLWVRRHRRIGDCGAVALVSILHHHGIFVDLREVQPLVTHNESGADLLMLKRATEAFGLHSTGLRGSYDALSSVPLPVIVHLATDDGAGHFVVLRQFDGGSVVISDGRLMSRRIQRAELCERWTGYLLLTSPDHQGSQGGLYLGGSRGFEASGLQQRSRDATPPS